MEGNRTVNKGDIYRHFKNKLYQVVAVAYHSETKEKYVVYQALYGDFKTYIRPFDMFMSEVDHVKYPDVSQKYRFEKVELDNAGKITWCESSSEQTLSDSFGDSETSGEMQADFYENPDDTVKSQETARVNPYLLEFLDKESIKDKIEYINTIKSKVDNRLISDIAAALDLTIGDGDRDDRFRQLVSCLKTMARFECGRLR